MTSLYTSEYLVNGHKSEETSDTVDKDGKKSVQTAVFTFELLRTDTLNTDTEEDTVVICKNDGNGDQLVLEQRADGKVKGGMSGERTLCLRTKGTAAPPARRLNGSIM